MDMISNDEIIKYIKDNYETRNDDVYFWSTFILPDGSFVLPENDDDEYIDDMYEHANIIGGVADNCFDGNWYDAEQWLEQNCVKGNVNYPYLHFPKNPTNKQYWAAEEYMDYLSGDTMGLNFDIFHAYDEEDISKMKTPVYVSIYGKGGKAYDLGVYKSSEIIDRIKKARVSGVLEESNKNQLTKDMVNANIEKEFRDSRVRSNDGQLIPCSLCEGERLFNDEYGIYFKPGDDYYLDIRNPLFIDVQGIRDVITYLRQYRKYDKEIDRYKEMTRTQYDYQVNEIKFIKYLGFDGIITYDKELFVVTSSNQVIGKNYDTNNVSKKTKLKEEVEYNKSTKYFTLDGKRYNNTHIDVKVWVENLYVKDKQFAKDGWVNSGTWTLTLDSGSSNNPSQWKWSLPYRLTDGVGGKLIAKANSLDEIKKYYEDQGYTYIEYGQTPPRSKDSGQKMSSKEQAIEYLKSLTYDYLINLPINEEEIKEFGSYTIYAGNTQTTNWGVVAMFDIEYNDKTLYMSDWVESDGELNYKVEVAIDKINKIQDNK